MGILSHQNVSWVFTAFNIEPRKVNPNTFVICTQLSIETRIHKKEIRLTSVTGY